MAADVGARPLAAVALPVVREVAAVRQTRAAGVVTASAASVIITGLIALVAIVGTIVLVALGVNVPGALWVFDAAIGTYYFGTSTRAAVAMAGQSNEDQAAEAAAAIIARHETTEG